MGVDCSHCKCTNKEDEKILIIENSNQPKIMTVVETRNDKMYNIEKVKNTNKLKLNDILGSKPYLINKIVRLQSLIKKYRNRKVYKAILKKFRVKIFIKSFINPYILL